MWDFYKDHLEFCRRCRLILRIKYFKLFCYSRGALLGLFQIESPWCVNPIAKYALTCTHWMHTSCWASANSRFFPKGIEWPLETRQQTKQNGCCCVCIYNLSRCWQYLWTLKVFLEDRHGYWSLLYELNIIFQEKRGYNLLQNWRSLCKELILALLPNTFSPCSCFAYRLMCGLGWNLGLSFLFVETSSGRYRCPTRGPISLSLKKKKKDTVTSR